MDKTYEELEKTNEWALAELKEVNSDKNSFLVIIVVLSALLAWMFSDKRDIKHDYEHLRMSVQRACPEIIGNQDLDPHWETGYWKKGPIQAPAPPGKQKG